MTPSDFQKLEQLFEEASALSPAEWPRFLDLHCPASPELRDALERMLQASGAEGILTNAVASALAQVPDSPAADPLEGQRLGGYRVLGHLASGGMAHVYLAERADDEFQKRVAIKVIQTGLGTEGFESRFRQERQILASLDHPHCCRLLDGGITAQGRPYLVMELVEGQTITAYAEARQLDLPQRLTLFRQLCSAVEYVHGNLIVHRDIKPSNVLVTAGGLVKLMDFGIAKLLAGSSGDGDLTAPLDRLATPAYGSPEQLRGEAITTATDVYSLGVLLEELLTGQRRQTGAVSAALPEELRAVLMRATHEEPARRYRSAGQFSDDIGRYLEGYPVLARPDSPWYRAAKFVRRNRVATAASALAVLALVGGLALTVREQRRTKQRFDEVRNLATVFLFEFDSLVRDLPGSTEARRRLVQRALGSLETLSRDAQNDLSLQIDIAHAYRKVAAIQYMNGRPHLGDRQGALASLDKELAIRQAVAAIAPGDRKNRAELAGAYGYISSVLDGVDPARVKEASARCGAILDQLEKEFPRDPGVLLQVGAHYLRRGLTLHKEGKLKESFAAEQRAIGLLERVRALKPDDLENLRFLGWAHIYAGDVLGGGGSEVHLGDRPGALVAMQKGKEVFLDSLKRDPTNGVAMRDLSAVEGRMAGTYEMMGDFAKAIAMRADVAARFDARMEADPKNAEAARDAAIEHSSFGLVLVKAGKLDEAEQQLRRAIEINDGRLRRFPQDVRASLDQANVEHTFGDLLAKRRRLPAAVERLRRAIQLRLPALQQNPDDRRLLWRQAKSYERLGEVLASAGDPAAARSAFTQALQRLETINRAGQPGADDRTAMEKLRLRLRGA